MVTWDTNRQVPDQREGRVSTEVQRIPNSFSWHCHLKVYRSDDRISDDRATLSGIVTCLCARGQLQSDDWGPPNVDKEDTRFIFDGNG
jgi:hypothetical protein